MTPERDERLLTQAQALPRTDAVRLLDLVSAALEATANGGSARIQLDVDQRQPELHQPTSALGLGQRAFRVLGKLGRQMLGVRGAAAVAAPEDAVSRTESRRNCVRDRRHARFVAIGVEQPAPVVDQGAKIFPLARERFYGSIQNISSPSDTSAPFSGNIRRTIPA